MTSSKPPETWVPTLVVRSGGFRVKLTSPDASVTYDVSMRELVRFYFQLRQALSGSAAKTRSNARQELTDDNSHEKVDP